MVSACAVVASTARTGGVNSPPVACMFLMMFSDHGVRFVSTLDLCGWFGPPRWGPSSLADAFRVPPPRERRFVASVRPNPRWVVVGPARRLMVVDELEVVCSCARGTTRDSQTPAGDLAQGIRNKGLRCCTPVAC